MYTEHMDGKQNTDWELTTISPIYLSGDIGRTLQNTGVQELYYDALENDTEAEKIGRLAISIQLSTLINMRNVKLEDERTDKNAHRGERLNNKVN